MNHVDTGNTIDIEYRVLFRERRRYVSESFAVRVGLCEPGTADWSEWRPARTNRRPHGGPYRSKGAARSVATQLSGFYKYAGVEIEAKVQARPVTTAWEDLPEKVAA